MACDGCKEKECVCGERYDKALGKTLKAIENCPAELDDWRKCTCGIHKEWHKIDEDYGVWMQEKM